MYKYSKELNYDYQKGTLMYGFLFVVEIINQFAMLAILS